MNEKDGGLFLEAKPLCEETTKEPQTGFGSVPLKGRIRSHVTFHVTGRAEVSFGQRVESGAIDVTT